MADPDVPNPTRHVPRLALEPLRAEHAARLFPLLADPRLYVYVDDEARASVALLAARFAELARGAPAGSNETWLNWVIWRRAGGAAIGTLQATLESDGRAWIGYLLTPSAWGQGFATEACHWLITDLAQRHGAREILASVDARNARSIALLERLQACRDLRCRVARRGNDRPSLRLSVAA
jgi:RimJ/RimL family protein N-acetyltransferase